jgi:hypothetical protein
MLILKYFLIFNGYEIIVYIIISIRTYIYNVYYVGIDFSIN